MTSTASSVADAFDEQLRRSAAALVAMARRLERDRPLSGGESDFLDGFRRLSESDPAVFSRVWSDPAAFAWTKRAFEALQGWVQAEGDGDLEAARCNLADALEAFAPLRLAGAHLAGERVELGRPLRFRGRLALPATPLTLEAHEPAELRGISATEVMVARAGAPGPSEAIAIGTDAAVEAIAIGTDAAVEAIAIGTDAAVEAGISLATWPVVDGPGGPIRLQPAVFRGAVDEAWPETADLVLQHRHAGPLAEALALIARFHPDAARLAERLRVVAFKPSGASPLGNTSSSELPGAIAFQALDDPWMLSENLVHELHHQRLFALEIQGPLFEDADQNRACDERHYSPWRDEPRPMKGLVHAAYVFVEVARHWLAVLDGSRPDESAGRWRARERLPFLSLQLPLVRDAIRAHARFSPLGREFFAETERRLDDLLARIAAAGIGADGETQRRVREHAERHDTLRALARLAPSLAFEASGPAPRIGDAGRVSCLCVTQGRPRRLAGALRCFQAQTWPDRELVIVYDADDAETADFVSDVARDTPSVVAVCAPEGRRLPLGALRNLAVARATGDWVCQWDDDDWYHPDRIAAQLACLEGSPRAVASVLSRWIVFDEASQRAYLAPNRTWEGSLLCRRSAVPAYPELRRGEDTPVVAALERSGGLVTLERPELYVYVVHDRNTWPRSHFSSYAQAAFDLGDARSSEVAERLTKAAR